MKKLNSLLAGLILAGLIAGCAWEKTAYNTTNVTTAAVDAAMKAYADEVQLGHVSVNTQGKVHTAYDKYYAALQVAKAGVLDYKHGAKDKAAVQVLLSELAATEKPLIDLIQQFSKK